MAETELSRGREWSLRPSAGAGLLRTDRASGWSVAVVIYVGTALAVTWPLVLHLSSGLYLSPGRPYGDYTGTIANLQATLSPFHFPFAPAHISAFNAPDGLALNWGLNLTSFPYIVVATILGLVFGATAAFGIILLLGFVASGLAMYGLVLWVTEKRLAALLAGWAFAFYPYALANGEHPVYVHGWPFVLMLWGLLAALKKPTIRRGSIAGLAGVLAMAWTSYYLLLGGLEFVAAVVACFLLAARRQRLRPVMWAFVPACGIVGFWVAFVLGLSAVDPSAGSHAVNQINDVYQQSALPLNYVLPSAGSLLFGSFTRTTILAHGWVGAEKTLYVGDSLLLLAAIAVVLGVLGRLPARAKEATVAAACVTLVAALCSQPPSWHVFGTRINLPSYYFFHVTSGFRIYERLVIVVEMGVCVLAAVGLAGICAMIARRKPALGRVIGACVTALVVVDVLAPVPHHFERLVADPIFKVLARQPPGAWAYLPLGPADTVPDYSPLFDQAAAGHPVMNGYPSGSSAEARDLQYANISLARSRAALQALGVRYLLYVRHPLPPLVRPPLPKRGVRLLAQDAFAKLYLNTTSPAPLITPGGGFSYLESNNNFPARWIVSPTAQLRIQARCTDCVGTMSFTTVSFAQPRTVTVRNASSGRVIGRRTGVGAGWKFPIRFDRTLTLSITTSPGPQSIAATTGSPDTRSVSVQVINPLVKLRGERHRGGW